MRRLLALVVGALVLGACTGGGGSAKDNGKPHSGGVFRIGMERPHSLDPAQAHTPEEILLADQLFDSLTTYDPVTLAVRPAVAASWTTTPDQQHWDFTISPSARFSSGRPITGTDVKYSLERISRRGSTATMSFLLEPITGFAAFNDPKGTAFPVRESTLEIAGKTGTAQTGYVNTNGDDPKKAWYLSRDHAWFASYFPARAPEIAVVVLVEHGGSGPTVAAPIAMSIIRDGITTVSRRHRAAAE